MKRIQIRQGDIFEVSVTNGKKYFQFIGLDITQLNSEIIRAFKSTYDADDIPTVDELVNDEIEFHAHTMIRLGYKMGLYTKIGASTNNLTEDVIWRQSEDVGNPEIKVSKRWLTWKTGRNMKQFNGELEELRNTEIGCVHNPIDVVEKMTNGEYRYFHHKFE